MKGLWNLWPKNEKEQRDWRAGYDAGWEACLAGEETPPERATLDYLQGWEAGWGDASTIELEVWHAWHDG